MGSDRDKREREGWYSVVPLSPGHIAAVVAALVVIAAVSGLLPPKYGIPLAAVAVVTTLAYLRVAVRRAQK